MVEVNMKAKKNTKKREKPKEKVEPRNEIVVKDGKVEVIRVIK